MSAVPALLAGKRRSLALLLALLALGEALLAVLFAAAINRVLAGADASLLPILAATGCAVMMGACLLLARWVGENFAQSFLADCRAAIFAQVVRQAAAEPPGAGADARWLTVLLNDMAALRNYALRGTVRLWTSVLAGGAAAGWIALTMPTLRPALIPLLLAACAISMLLLPLTRAIAAQRGARGRLNRFLIRRIRAELSRQVSPKGHGLRKLDRLSRDIASASVRRAQGAGWMDALAMLGGLLAALVAVLETRTAAPAQDAGIAGSLMLLAFVAARLLETARALHAQAGGRIALVRVGQLLKTEPASDIARSVLRLWAARSRQKAVRVLALPGRPARRSPPPGSRAGQQETGA